MKFEINRALLENTLSSVSKGLSTKTPLPVLTGIYLTAANDTLTFITTNKEISVRMILEKSDKMNIIEEGTVLVPGKFFCDIVKKIEGEIVEFTVFEDKTIKIISKNTDFTLNALDKSKFPPTLFELNCEPIKLTCKELRQIVKQTTFACAVGENRVILTSVNFAINGDNLSVTATDSYRLSKKMLAVNGDGESHTTNIPAKSLEEVSKIVPDSNEEISLFILPGQATFKYKNLSFNTRLVEGKYPDTSGSFPKSYYMTAKFNRSALISAVDKASLFVSEQFVSIVKLSFKKESNEVELSSNSSEIGKVVDYLTSLETNDSKDFQLAFSTKTLLDALRAFDSQDVVLKFTGEVKPTLIVDENDQSLIQMLVPIRWY